MTNPNTSDYQVCTRCVMDTTDPTITFDANGTCNHCRDYDAKTRPLLLPPAQRDAEFNNMIAAIKAAGRGRKYDCLLGLSGGVDSSYLAWLAWKHELRTLLVHMDNGWDSELAVKNIENIVKSTGFDYYNHVIDWDEFRELQLAYFRASVVDIEVVTDHAIDALVFRAASKFRIKYILNGGNHVTESIMPCTGWNWPLKNDLANLMAIHRAFGRGTLKTYPLMGMYKIRYYQALRGFRYVDLLDLVPYRLEDAIATLEREFDWRYYGGKHWESVFTKFYQAYILPTKFNVDKRKAHFSTLICSGQMTRDEALRRLALPIYPPESLAVEYDYCVKKLSLTRDEFERIMRLPVVAHDAFPTEATARSYRLMAAFWDTLSQLVRLSRRARRALRTILTKDTGRREIMRRVACAIRWRIRDFRSKSRRAYSAWQRKRTRITEEDILTALQSFGPFSAPALMVHSSLSACGQIQGGSATVVAALKSWIATDKLLVMPAHTYCYPATDGSVTVFNITETPSVVGNITDFFWRQPGVSRSLHPTHSLACLGPDSAALCAGHEFCDTPCGHGTPYEKLVQQDCSVLMFGCRMDAYTLFHTAEDAAQVPYLYMKQQYSLRIRDHDGCVRPFPMWRQDMTVKRSFAERADWLQAQGLLLRVQLGRGELLFIPSAKAVHQSLLLQLAKDPLFLLDDTIRSNMLTGLLPISDLKQRRMPCITQGKSPIA
jgi:N-acetyl sugar amidotransferase